MSIKTDALIVGAGPCGLFQIFELGLLGIKAHIVDVLDKPGGQCAELYPDKPIYDIPAIAVCDALELVDMLMQQIAPFEAGFHLEQQVAKLQVVDEDSFNVITSTGTEFQTRSVIVAGGVGSFQPQQLRVDGVTELVDKHVFYRIQNLQEFRDRDIVILGGGDSAFDWTLELVDVARSTTLIHRSDRFRSAPASVNKMASLKESGALSFMVGNVTGLIRDGDTLKQIEVTKPDRSVELLQLDDLLVFFGLSPKLGPITKWGLEIERNQIATDTEKFETNIPGIYAIGDIATYPGKKKLILSGFHEAALAAFAIKARLNPGEKVHLQYTTTSPIMHERLGIK